MAIARRPPTCPKCGETIKGIFKDQSNVPIMHRLIGDTFIRWNWEGHMCRLGTLYFIERTDTQQWAALKGVLLFGTVGWTVDPMKAIAFKTKKGAETYLKMALNIPARLECVVTEHEFVSPAGGENLIEASSQN